MARPGCPIGQPGLAEELTCMTVAILDVVFLFDMVEQQLC
jgi:hypothetical protein